MTTPFQLSGQGTATSTLQGRDFFGGTINGPGASSSTGAAAGGIADLAKQVAVGVAVALVIGFVLKRMK